MERYLDFRSKGHARIHIAQCKQTGAFFKKAIGIHGPIEGYVNSLRILVDEMQQAASFIEENS